MQILDLQSLSLTELALRFGTATSMPLAIGLERFLRRKPIDFRPFVIISVVACGAVIATTEFALDPMMADLPVDPGRIMQGVITGIGFLGAGAMFRDGDFIKGAGSAASIWSAGIIGLLCGMGAIGIAVLITGIILGLMLVSERFTRRWDNTTD